MNDPTSGKPAAGVDVPAVPGDVPFMTTPDESATALEVRNPKGSANEGVAPCGEAQPLVWQFKIGGGQWQECSEKNARAYREHGAPFKVRALREVAADGVTPCTEPEPRMYFCPACFVEVTPEQAGTQTNAARVLAELLLCASPHDPHRNKSNAGRWVTINAPRELVDRARALGVEGRKP